MNSKYTTSQFDSLHSPVRQSKTSEKLTFIDKHKYDIQNEPPRFHSAEALIRWHHPELGVIPPGDFIPLFEANGQISEIDRYVWREAARQIAEWREKYGVTITVSVNLSRIDALDPALEQTLDNLMKEYSLEYSCLHLEVTESAYTEDADQLRRVIQRLRGKGYKVEMDDFGSGYSSLNMLSSIPIDVLKMDMGFISQFDSLHSPVRQSKTSEKLTFIDKKYRA